MSTLAVDDMHDALHGIVLILVYGTRCMICMMATYGTG